MRKKIQPKTRTDFFAFSESLISELISEGRYGTSQSYEKAITSLKSFLGHSPNDSLPFEQIDEVLIYRYNHHLSSKGIIRNSISFYNRALRAIYNKAVKRYHIPDKRPFLEVYTGVDRTRSRAVSESLIGNLMTLDLSYDKSLELTRDLFIFSYATRGMAFVDMAYLRKSNIHGNYLTYLRRKTGVRVDVRLEPQIKGLLMKYTIPGNEYLLPILQNTPGKSEHPEDPDLKMYQHYQAQLAIYNRKLKELSEALKTSVSLTSYVSRHSWATAARNTGTSMSVISEGLGHSSERMTRIYLGSFDSDLIDAANRRLLGRIKKYADGGRM